MRLVKRILFNLSYVSILFSVANAILCFQLERDFQKVLTILNNNVEIQNQINRQLAKETEK